MDSKDKRMKELLAKWQGIECSPFFNEGVLARIRSASVPKRQWLSSCVALLHERLALVTAEVALAGAMAGVVLALLIVPPVRVAGLKPFSFMSSDSLSGSINKLAGMENR